jgi:hypothetical protein
MRATFRYVSLITATALSLTSCSAGHAAERPRRSRRPTRRPGAGPGGVGQRYDRAARDHGTGLAIAHHAVRSRGRPNTTGKSSPPQWPSAGGWKGATVRRARSSWATNHGRSLFPSCEPTARGDSIRPPGRRGAVIDVSAANENAVIGVAGAIRRCAARVRIRRARCETERDLRTAVPEHARSP